MFYLSGLPQTLVWSLVLHALYQRRYQKPCKCPSASFKSERYRGHLERERDPSVPITTGFLSTHLCNWQPYKHLSWQAHLNTKAMGFCILQSFLLDYDGNSGRTLWKKDVRQQKMFISHCLIMQCFVFLQLVRIECKGGVALLCVSMNIFSSCCVTVVLGCGYWFKLFNSGSPHS